MNLIVIGAGYVALTTTCCLANSGHRVTCVQNDEEAKASKSRFEPHPQKEQS